MPITPTPITGGFVLPDGAEPVGARLILSLSRADASGSHVVLRRLEAVSLAEGGALPEGFALWPNIDGYAGTHYRGTVEYRLAGRVETDDLLPFAVGDDEAYTIGELQAQGPSGTLTLQARIPDGTAAAPGLAFVGDRETGVYRTVAGRVALAIEGVAQGDLVGSDAAQTLTDKTLVGGEVAGARITIRTRDRTLADRGGETINVLDFAGVDPVGNNSSLAAFQAAVNELKIYNASSTTGGQARLVIPPNRGATARYVIDGSLDMTAIRAQMTHVDARGARIWCTGSHVSIDMMHSNSIVWTGGIIQGDSADPPWRGVQVARQYANADYPSSQNHAFRDLVITGTWREAAFFNFGSERLLCEKVMFGNDLADVGAYAVAFDGQSRVFPHRSAYRPVDPGSPAGPWLGAATGFSANQLRGCGFFRNVGEVGQGPALFVSRVQQLEIDGIISQTGGHPFCVVYTDSAISSPNTLGLRLSGRCEVGTVPSLIRFAGTSNPYVRGVEINVDRLFAQAVFDTAPGVEGVRLLDLDVRAMNLTPGTKALCADPTKFARITGRVAINQRNTAAAENNMAAMTGFDVAEFVGEIRVTDRTNIGPLPLAGRYTIWDEVANRPPLTVQAAFGDGTAASPALHFGSDPNTGIYSGGADVIGLSTGGTSRMLLSTSALTTTLPVLLPAGTAAAPALARSTDTDTGTWFPAANTWSVTTGGTEVFRVNAAGDFLSGVTARLSGFPAGTVFAGATLREAGMALARFSDAATPPALGLANIRTAGYEISQFGDNLGEIRWYGADGATLVQGAAIRSLVRGTPASGDIRSDLRLLTRGSGGLSVKVTLTEEGAVGIGTATPSAPLHVAGPIRTAALTVGTLPSAATVGAGTIAYASDAAGGAIPVFSDGSDWRRMDDRAVVT